MFGSSSAKSNKLKQNNTGPPQATTGPFVVAAASSKLDIGVKEADREEDEEEEDKDGGNPNVANEPPEQPGSVAEGPEMPELG